MSPGRGDRAIGIGDGHRFCQPGRRLCRR
jgi:hypothetical protein